MIRSTRGAHGGVQLARPPQEIKLSEVLGVLEGSIAPVDCINDPKACPRSELCVTRDVWIELKEAMDGVLESKTLQELVEMQKKKKTADTVMYDI
jgi:Rrf2 family protein